MKALRRYWGYGLLALVVGAVVNGWLGPPAIMVGSALCIFYFSLQAPTWCMVENRDGTYCRDNARGFFLGCHRRQHKWQKFKLTFVSKFWRNLGAALRREPIEGIKTLTVLLGLVGGFVTLSITLIKIKFSV